MTTLKRSMPRSPYVNLWDRLMSNSACPESAQDCWRWTARLDREGYGLIDIHVPGLGRNATLKAHIVAAVWLEVRPASADEVFLAYKEHSASGLEWDHLCGEQWCINPDHLDLVTGAENCKRRDARRTRQ